MLLREQMKIKNVTYNWHEPDVSFLEGVFARGDRRLGASLVSAWRKGCKFDAWNEYFRINLWREAFAETGIDPTWYANRERTRDEVLPWEHLSCGVTKAYLWREYEQAKAGVTTPDCPTQCTGCGAVSLLMGGACHA